LADNRTTNNSALSVIGDTGVIAILRGTDFDELMDTAEALYAGGIRALEVTFNTAGAKDMIQQIASHYRDRLHVGAGTVLNRACALQAIGAGAEFVLAPNTDLDVIAAVKEYGRVMIPGALTPTEVLRCHDAGVEAIKVFPAGSVGPKYIRDLLGPYNGLRLLPVGGVDLRNAGAFIKAGAFALGVGGSLVRSDLVSKKDFRGLTTLAGEFLQAVREARGVETTAKA